MSRGATMDLCRRYFLQVASGAALLAFPGIARCENRPGAGGNVGAEALVNASADGYTLLLVPPAVAANPTLYEHLNFNFIRDTTPVGGVVSRMKLKLRCS